MRRTAQDLGVGDTFRKTPVGVFFGMPGVRVPDPYFGGAGPARTGCTECGNCMVGCRVGAKNTLVKNYLALAERLGATIEPLRTVVDVRPLPGSSAYRVTTEATGAWLRKDRRTVTAQQVVFAAGAWGTQRLLHTLRDTGALPRLSDRLGHLTRTNSEALGGATLEHVPRGVDLTRGVAITSSFHPDDDTHVENVRFGKGSNAMGALGTILVDGGGPVPRPVRFLARRGAPPGRVRPLALAVPLERAHGHRPGDADPRQLPDRLEPPRAPRRPGAHLSAGSRRAQPHLDPGRSPRAGRPRGAPRAGHRASRLPWQLHRRGRRRADDGPLPRRRGHRGRSRRAASSTPTTGCGATPACTWSTARRSRPTSGSTPR